MGPPLHYVTIPLGQGLEHIEASHELLIRLDVHDYKIADTVLGDKNGLVPSRFLRTF